MKGHQRQSKKLKTNSSIGGLHGVYKPKGPTSHDIIDQLRKITGERKIGHAGTLDPLAKGVLIVGIGRPATKKLGSMVKKDKEYTATLKLGEISDTDDSEGPIFSVIPESPQGGISGIYKKPTLSQVKKISSKFVGKIKQVPPRFCAVKIKGKEAYKYARKGKSVKIRPRQVEIKKLRILNYKWPLLKLKIVTGPGVYIRSLARDVGKSLKCGAYLCALERTRVGNVNKEKSLKISEIKAKLC